VVPSNLGEIGIAERGNWRNDYAPTVLVMANGGESVCWRHALLLADGAETYRERVGEAGVARSSLYNLQANLHAMAAFRALARNA
jgi:hypothetical protein